jgi:predicted kinase
MYGMPDEPRTRSVKISEDERRGWSSDRPRRDGEPPRPASLSVRSRVLSPSDQVRYPPGSLLVIVSPSTAERERFAERLIGDRASLLSLNKVRALLAGRASDEDIAARAVEIHDAAVLKRLEANETVVLVAEGLAADEREHYVRMAARFKRSSHLLLVDTSRDGVHEDDLGALNELRRRLDAGELGAEGFKTALRLGGESLTELKRIVLLHPPRDD